MLGLGGAGAEASRRYPPAISDSKPPHAAIWRALRATRLERKAGRTLDGAAARGCAARRCLAWRRAVHPGRQVLRADRRPAAGARHRVHAARALRQLLGHQPPHHVVVAAVLGHKLRLRPAVLSLLPLPPGAPAAPARAQRWGGNGCRSDWELVPSVLGGASTASRGYIGRQSTDSRSPKAAMWGALRAIRSMRRGAASRLVAQSAWSHQWK